jgi:hypothetical protein
VGRALARELGWVQHSVDMHCWEHYRELPEVREAAVEDRNRRRYLERLQEIIEREHGSAHWWTLWDRMRLHAALRCLGHEGPVIIDLGAGHARFDDPARRAALDEALQRCRLAIWLQPWSEPARAAECLAQRLSAIGAEVDRPALLRACEPSQRPRSVEPMFTEERTSETIAALLRDRIQRSV